VTTRQHKVHTQLGRAAVQIFAANDRMNQILIEHLDPTAWRAKPPGKARTIAAIFTHMHNVRSKWVRLTAPHLKVPRQLNRANCTPQQARAGLAESAVRCAEMLRGSARRQWGPRREVSQRRLGSALAGGSRNVGPHAFSRSPPSRQVCMLAHQLGFPLPNKSWRFRIRGSYLNRLPASRRDRFFGL
jgi:hypothetical protein